MEMLLTAAITFSVFLSILTFIMTLGMGKRQNNTDKAVINIADGFKVVLKLLSETDAKAVDAQTKLSRFIEDFSRGAN